MKNKKYIVYLVVSILVLTIGVSYAYFKARVSGEGKSISLRSKGIYVLYSGDATLASESISPGWSVTKEFTVENQGSNNEVYNIYIEGLINTFVTSGYLQYKITSSNGYNMSEYKDIPKSNTSTDTVLAYSVPIKSKEKQIYKVELIYKDTDEDQSADMGKILSGILGIQVGTKDPNILSLKDAMLRDNPTIKERTDFSVTNTETTTGTLYKTNKTEDGSDVYYYSGNTTNNWVKFGKYQGDSISYRGYYSSTNLKFKEYSTIDKCTSATSYNTNCSEYKYASVGDDIYWRIIRTNEDGSVRLIYSGTSPDTTTAYISVSSYNIANSHSMHVGYMYGTFESLTKNRTNNNDSTIKAKIDTWYQNNLLTNYDKYISKTAIYCNDRSVGAGTYVTIGSKIFYYGGYMRIKTGRAPSYKCGANTSNGLFESTQAIEDKFSASTEGGGNGQLKYPIALMTGDEVAFAGGRSSRPLESPYAWYYTNSVNDSITGTNSWWVLTPYSYDSASYVYSVGDSSDLGNILGSHVYNFHAIRPVISISECAKVTGTGTPTDPYVIDTNASRC